MHSARGVRRWNRRGRAGRARKQYTSLMQDQRPRTPPSLLNNPTLEQAFLALNRDEHVRLAD
jgi:hypothetical protein